MTRIVPLNNHTHLKLRVHAKPSTSFGDDQRFVPVVVGEFAPLALHYPLMFSKDSDTGRFYCGAMLGFDTGENLFSDEHRDHSLYRPLNLQRGPFFTAGEDLAIDLDHPRVTSSGDTALFNDDGDPSAYLKSIMGLMRDLTNGADRTRQFIETLLALHLIEPLTIKAQFDDGSRREIAGLYTVNHDSVKTLGDAEVLDLFRRGYLQLIHLQVASLAHVATLTRRKNRSFLQAPAALSA